MWIVTLEIRARISWMLRKCVCKLFLCMIFEVTLGFTEVQIWLGGMGDVGG